MKNLNLNINTSGAVATVALLGALTFAALIACQLAPMLSNLPR